MLVGSGVIFGERVFWISNLSPPGPEMDVTLDFHNFRYALGESV